MSPQSTWTRLDWLTPEWWYGLADYAGKLAFVVGALALGQLVVGAPKVDHNIEYQGLLAQIGDPPPPYLAGAMQVVSLKVTIRNAGATEVKGVEVVPNPRFGYVSVLPDAGKIGTMPPDDERQVDFVVPAPVECIQDYKPGQCGGFANASEVSGDNDWILVKYDHSSQPLVGLQPMIFAGFALLVGAGAVTSIIRGRPLGKAKR